MARKMKKKAIAKKGKVARLKLSSALAKTLAKRSSRGR